MTGAAVAAVPAIGAESQGWHSILISVDMYTACSGTCELFSNVPKHAPQQEETNMEDEESRPPKQRVCQKHNANKNPAQQDAEQAAPTGAGAAPVPAIGAESRGWHFIWINVHMSMKKTKLKTK